MKPLQVDEIFQPRKFAFPSHNFGEEVQHFKGTWFGIHGFEKDMISGKNSEKAFISEGY